MSVVAFRLPDATSSGRLPPNYEQARQALARCEKIDECQDWADKAEALSSYARQVNDTSLRVLADRIQARAVRRAGELLKKYDARPQNSAKQKDADDLLLSRTEAAEAAGLSERQRKTAVRVANIPTEEFESRIESHNPPTISQLAMMARGRRGRSDAGPSREEELRATAPGHDFLNAVEADRAIILTAERLDNPLFLPTPGILACLKDALARASPRHRKAIQEAARTLSELVK